MTPLLFKYVASARYVFTAVLQPPIRIFGSSRLHADFRLHIEDRDCDKRGGLKQTKMARGTVAPISSIGDVERSKVRGAREDNAFTCGEQRASGRTNATR